MAFSAHRSQKNPYAVLKWVSYLCFAVAGILAAATVIMAVPHVRQGLNSLNEWFLEVESIIGELNKAAAFGVILLSFVFKAFIPFLPFNVLFIASGLVFPPAVAWVINIAGFAVLVDIKFMWGKKRGGGGAHRFLIKYSTIKSFMKLGGDGNKLMLAVLRFIPFVPVGTVSRIYGATDMKIIEFTFFSILGYLPRLVLWSQVGSNFTNPFTFAFTAPIIVLLIISGLALLLLNKLLSLVGRSDAAA